MPLVTDAQVRTQLNIDEGEDVSTYVAAAERIAADHFLNREIYEDQAALDAANDATGIVVNAAIRAGILRITADLYRDRESDKQGVYSPSSMATAVLLSPYRAGMGV
jgi:hypothetical protein